MIAAAKRAIATAYIIRSLSTLPMDAQAPEMRYARNEIIAISSAKENKIFSNMTIVVVVNI